MLGVDYYTSYRVFKYRYDIGVKSQIYDVQLDMPVYKFPSERAVYVSTLNNSNSNSNSSVHEPTIPHQLIVIYCTFAKFDRVLAASFTTPSNTVY